MSKYVITRTNKETKMPEYLRKFWRYRYQPFSSDLSLRIEDSFEYCSYLMYFNDFFLDGCIIEPVNQPAPKEHETKDKQRP